MFQILMSKLVGHEGRTPPQMDFLEPSGTLLKVCLVIFVCPAIVYPHSKNGTTKTPKIKSIMQLTQVHD